VTDWGWVNPGSSDSYDGIAQHVDVAVIGGGQAGLAIGGYLGQQVTGLWSSGGRNFAPAWRER
jgi:hypothetical protein